ncbi:MAG: lysylphosphatidylglycerol synthase transmembrane domain-containing protein [Thermoleophilia bacterium]
MSRVFKILRRYGLQLLTVAIVLYVLFFHVEYDELYRAFINVSWTFVLLAIIANLTSIMLKVASWKIIFDFTFDGIKGRWRDLTSALMIGFLVNLIVPARLGELARAFVISRRENVLGHTVSRSTVFGTIVLERVFDGVAMAMIVIYGVVHMDLPGWADKGAIVLLVISGFFAIAMVVLEIKRERITETAEQAEASLEEHHPWWRRWSIRFYGVVARFSEGQKVLRSPGRVVLICLTTATSWLAQLTAVFFSLHAFHLGYIGFLGALLLLILINVAGALPATPGNVGVFQLATVIPLTVTYGIPKTTALAFSVGLQIIEGSIGLVGGSSCLLREGLKFDQVRSGAREFEEEVEERAEEELEDHRMLEEKVGDIGQEVGDIGQEVKELRHKVDDRIAEDKKDDENRSIGSTD